MGFLDNAGLTHLWGKVKAALGLKMDAATYDPTGKAQDVFGYVDGKIAQLPSGLALGETASTAYRGDRGKVAYDHVGDAVKHITAAERTAWNAKQGALTFDNTPTVGSANPITSGGVAAAIGDIDSILNAINGEVI